MTEAEDEETIGGAREDAEKREKYRKLKIYERQMGSILWLLNAISPLIASPSEWIILNQMIDSICEIEKHKYRIDRRQPTAPFPICLENEREEKTARAAT